MRVGILGGGQLGQMLVLSAYPLGIETTTYETAHDCPASLVGAVEAGRIDETEKLHAWASGCDVITYEWENFPAPLVADLSEIRPVLPDTISLATAQDRWHEKRLFTKLKIPVSPFRLIENDADIQTALTELKLPLIFKTRTGGYDGKGQVVFNAGDSTDAVRELLASGPLVAEERQNLTKEISIIGVRGADGLTETYPLTENEHHQGILHKSTVPAAVSADLAADAKAYITLVLKKLDYVGVLTLELFVVGDRLLANEMAPRVHNSGHWTIEGAETSQFENHMRAITGLPLGSPASLVPTAMVNLVGALPSTKAVLRIAGAHLHLYGKAPRPGRKVGHITITAPDVDLLRERVFAVETMVHNVFA